MLFLIFTSAVVLDLWGIYLWFVKSDRLEGMPLSCKYIGLAHNTYLVVAILRAIISSGEVQLTPRVISVS